jgi:hypothetical protein
MRMFTRPLNPLLFAAALLIGCGPVGAAAEVLAPVPQPEPMPAFAIPAINGGNYSDKDLRNKVTIIRFWASW